MQKYKSNVTTSSGSALRNVAVRVLKEDGSLAALWEDRQGTVPASNPRVTGSDGTFTFYAANGRYTLDATVEGVQYIDDDAVLLLDPEDVDSGAFAYQEATQDEAEDEGEAGLRSWSPLRVWQAVVKWGEGLGTAASKDVPESGDAAADQVVLGDDTRLSDAREPVGISGLIEPGVNIRFTGSGAAGDPFRIDAASDISTGVQSDWNESDISSEAFIKNKPSIPAASNNAPANLGNASAGDDAQFSRADHVHEMPSATDVKAIPAFSDLNPATASQDDDLFAIAQDKGGGVLETRKLTAALLYNAFRVKNDQRYAQLAEAVHFLQTLDVSGAVALLDTLSVAGKATLDSLDVSGAVALQQMPQVGGSDIVSQGSNANGEWVQFADGTLICWGISGIMNALGTLQGSMYKYDQNVIDYPKAFSTAPGLAIAPYVDATYYGGSYSSVGGGEPSYPVSTTSTGRVRGLGSSNNPNGMKFSYVAAGRWI